MSQETNVVSLHKPERDRLVCIACFASVEVPCDCGVEHKRMKPGELAKLAVIKHPDMSNRAIAKFVGVSGETVRRAREETSSTATFVAVEVEERMGLDGKVRKIPDRSRWHSCSTNPIPLPQSLQESRVGHAMGTLRGLSYSDLQVLTQRIKEEEPKLWQRLQKLISQ